MRNFFRVLIVLFLLTPALANDSRGVVLHIVKPGDTLGTLSRFYGLSPEELRRANQWRLVEESKTYWIPVAAAWPRHKVREGETLQAISEGYGIPLQQLRDANSLVTDPLPHNCELFLPRAQKPEWRVKGIQASRSGRIPRPPLPLSEQAAAEPRKPEGTWVKIKTADGREGWARVDGLSYRPSAVATPSTTLSFGRKLSESQKTAIHDIVRRLEGDGLMVEADHIAVFMALETGGSFSPSIRAGGRPDGAVGLAQFTDIAIQDMNSRRPAHDQLSKSRLAQMSFEEQSQVVAEYLSNVLKCRKMQGRQVTGHDLYAAVFAPKAVGQPESFVVYGRDKDGGAYHRNSSLDLNRDGHITKAEMAGRFDVWAGKGESLRQ